MINFSKTDCEVIFFISSSGHCTLNCQYCIVSPIAKHKPSLSYEDYDFLLSAFNYKKAFLTFSGLGDFFAGYACNDKLLDRILDHDVEVALDVNGVLLHEFSTLSEEKLNKIVYVNLTMHYHQLKKYGMLEQWSRNAILLHTRIPGHPIILQGYIVSPSLMDEWQAAVDYYSASIYPHTGQKLLLIKDINQVFTMEQEDRLRKLLCEHSGIVSALHSEDFSAVFTGRGNVLCPAGKSYFRIWNDGAVQGCPNLPDVPYLLDGGNIKERRINIADDPFCCATPRYCDCNVIASLGKMGEITEN